MNTYACQSSRDVPSLYLMYAAKAFNTPSVPPIMKFFPLCVEKIEFPILSVLNSLELGLFSLLPLLENFARTIASAVVFLIESHSSLGSFNRVLFINSFKASSVGMVPNDFITTYHTNERYFIVNAILVLQKNEKRTPVQFHLQAG